MNFFDCQLHPSNSGHNEHISRDWWDRYAVYTGAVIMVSYTGIGFSSFLSQDFHKAHGCTVCWNYIQTWPETGLKIKTKTRGFIFPSFPHIAFFLPTPMYSFFSAWKLAHDDNLSSTDLYVTTNIVSLEWITSQIHSALRYQVSLLLIHYLCLQKSCISSTIIYFWNPNSTLSLLTTFLFLKNTNWGASIHLDKLLKNKNKKQHLAIFSPLRFCISEAWKSTRWSLCACPWQEGKAADLFSVCLRENTCM